MASRRIICWGMLVEDDEGDEGEEGEEEERMNLIRHIVCTWTLQTMCSLSDA